MGETLTAEKYLITFLSLAFQCSPAGASNRIVLLDLPMVILLLGRYMQATISDAISSLIRHQLDVETPGQWAAKMPPLDILLPMSCRPWWNSTPSNLPTAF